MTDTNGCSGNAAFTITQPDPLLTTGDVITDPACPQGRDGTITVNAIAGTAPYSYRWDDDNTLDTPIRTGLSQGTYNLTITDANGCSLQKKYTLNDPAGLEIVNEVVTSPSCFAQDDGAISAQAIGGVTPYTYSWSNGATTANIDRLTEGSYTLTVSDAQGCAVSRTFNLSQPEELFVTGISDYILICEGGSVRLEPDTQWASYSWKTPDGSIENTPHLQASMEGEYTLDVTDNNGCPASFTSFLEVSANALQADFLRISEAVPFEKMIFVDISLPIPQNSEWIIPEDQGIVIDQVNPGSIELVFTQTGDFIIGMKVTSDDCESEVFKTVTISENAEKIAGRQQGKAPQIKVAAFPNPASDNISFNINVEDERPVTMVLMSNLNGRRIRTQTIKGSKDYLVKWDVSDIKPGIYQLYLNQNNNITSKRILIQR